MEVMQEALRREEASSRAMQEEQSGRLRQQESMSVARLEAEAKRSEQLTRDLEEARTRTNSAEERIKGLDEELRDLRDQLQVARLPSPETEADLRTLRSRVATLEAAEMKSTLRAKTIDSRYRVGDLVRCSIVLLQDRVSNHPAAERRGKDIRAYSDSDIASHS